MIRHALTAACIFIYGITLSQGLTPVAKEKFDNYSEWSTSSEAETRGFGYGFGPEITPIKESDLPGSITLAPFCPPSLNQGYGYTSVGWAVSYFAMSTQMNAILGISDLDLKSLLAFDPLALSYYKNSSADDWCMQGMGIPEALDFLMKRGTKFMFADPILTCSSKFERSPNSDLRKISSWRKIDFVKKGSSVLKEALYYKKPIIIGFPIWQGLLDQTSIKSGILVSTPKDIISYQAMCIIGYSQINGRLAFEVATSYGQDYGADGIFYVYFDDLKSLATEAYVIDLNNPFGFETLTSPEYVINLSYVKKTGQEGLDFCLKRNPDSSIYLGFFSNGSPSSYGALIQSTGVKYYTDYPVEYTGDDSKCSSKFLEFKDMFDRVYGY
jgi:hypothetical protein